MQCTQCYIAYQKLEKKCHSLPVSPIEGKVKILQNIEKIHVLSLFSDVTTKTQNMEKKKNIIKFSRDFLYLELNWNAEITFRLWHPSFSCSLTRWTHAEWLMLSDSFYSLMWCEFWYSSVIIIMTLHLTLNLRKAEIKAETSGTNDDAEG